MLLIVSLVVQAGVEAVVRAALKQYSSCRIYEDELEGAWPEKDGRLEKIKQFAVEQGWRVVILEDGGAIFVRDLLVLS